MQYCEKRAWLCLFRQAMLFIAGFMLIFGAAQAEAAGFAERAGSMSEIKAVRVSSSADKTRIVLAPRKHPTRSAFCPIPSALWWIYRMPGFLLT